jgi:small nuclear ribonucleoprotein (snRNP)-like protein
MGGFFSPPFKVSFHVRNIKSLVIMIKENLRKYRNKYVKVTTTTNKIFQGVLHIPNNEKIVLSQLEVIDKNGVVTAKQKERKYFTIQEIKNIEVFQ